MDDVDNLYQLEYTIGQHEWLYPRNRIIITTKHKHFLDVHKVNETYEDKEFNYE